MRSRRVEGTKCDAPGEQEHHGERMGGGPSQPASAGTLQTAEINRNVHHATSMTISGTTGDTSLSAGAACFPASTQSRGSPGLALPFAHRAEYVAILYAAARLGAIGNFDSRDQSTRSWDASFASNSSAAVVLRRTAAMFPGGR
jgi:hypothetical protein